jgi:pimeloyl-ACP methyl ester carboxylesterase
VAFLKTDDGVSVYYEHHEPNERRGAAVVFSCAYTTTHENWRGQVAPILAAGHPVVLWDLRGHGQTATPDDDAFFSIDLVVSDLLAVAEATTPEAPFIAAGLSFGGLASLHFMRAHPDRVSALALIGSGPGFKNPEAAAGWAAQVERTAAFLENRGFADFIAGRAGVTCIGAKPELPAAKHAAAAILAQTVSGVARFGRQVSGLAPTVIDDLSSMKVPALVLVGESDKAFLRAGDVMAAKLPQSKKVVIAGAGHIVNIEEEVAFNAALIEFLGELA